VESVVLQSQDAQALYNWPAKEIASPSWKDKSDDTKRDQVEERRRQIA